MQRGGGASTPRASRHGRAALVHGAPLRHSRPVEEVPRGEARVRRHRRVVVVRLPHQQPVQHELVLARDRGHGPEVRLQVADAEVDVVVAQHEEARAGEECRPEPQPLEVLERAAVQALRHIEEEHVAVRIRLAQQRQRNGDGRRIGCRDEGRWREQEAQRHSATSVLGEGGAQLTPAPDADRGVG
eukprot:scaffold21832_cov62-Phaeocystis_antarctica.AAC.6